MWWIAIVCSYLSVGTVRTANSGTCYALTPRCAFKSPHKLTFIPV